MPEVFHMVLTSRPKPALLRRYARLGAAAAALWLGAACACAGDQDISLEYKVKAAFLLNFAKFVTWPAAKFAENDSPIIIGVAGSNPFGDYLTSSASGKTVNGRAIEIRNLALEYEDPPADGSADPHKLKQSGVDAIKACHILFVPEAQRADEAAVLAAAKGASLLFVGERDGFALAGGVVNFFLQNGKVRFEINPDEAARQALEISSKLLSLAKIVHDADGKK